MPTVLSREEVKDGALHGLQLQFYTAHYRRLYPTIRYNSMGRRKFFCVIFKQIYLFKACKVA